MYYVGKNKFYALNGIVAVCQVLYGVKRLSLEKWTELINFAWARKKNAVD